MVLCMLYIRCMFELFYSYITLMISYISQMLQMQHTVLQHREKHVH